MLNMVVYRGLTDAGSRLINEVVEHFYSKEIRGENNRYCETRDRDYYFIFFLVGRVEIQKWHTVYSTKQHRINAARHLHFNWLATVFKHRRITNCTTQTKYTLFFNILSKYLEKDDTF
jgi:hypothetical protein